MTISNTSRGLRPGVCLSTNRPANPFDGQVIYETDTDLVKAFNGTDFVTVGPTPTPGLELVKTQTIGTTVASVTVTGAFSATYDNYKIIVSGGAGSASLILLLQFGATTTGYFGGSNRVTYSTGAVATSGFNNAASVHCGRANASGISAVFDVVNPFTAKNTVMSGTDIALATAGSGGHTVGWVDNTTSYTAFTLTTSTGTLTGGTINVYGYRN